MIAGLDGADVFYWTSCVSADSSGSSIASVSEGERCSAFLTPDLEACTTSSRGGLPALLEGLHGARLRAQVTLRGSAIQSGRGGPAVRVFTVSSSKRVVVAAAVDEETAWGTTGAQYQTETKVGKPPGAPCVHRRSAHRGRRPACLVARAIQSRSVHCR